MKTAWRISAWTSTLAVVLTALPQPASAGRNKDIEKMLKQFSSDPASVLNARPIKRDARGRALPVESIFTEDQILSGDYISARDKIRGKRCAVIDGARVCLDQIQPGRAAFGANDLAQNLVDNGAQMIRSAAQMESSRLLSAHLAESPWSDDYWAIYKGVLSARYADDSFPSDPDWKANKDYADANPIAAILAQPNSSSVDTLSPAEKYDLLVGDTNFTLTKQGWAQGEQYYRQNGKVETWMGICHGWAPAAYMLPRPEKAITVTAANGRTKIRMYPSDIKALASALWATAETPSRFIGGRCDDKDPAKDEIGRVISPQCVDTNAGTWHMAVVNQIGVAKRSFVLDATFDYEVWNQPVHAYRYSYFNPKTGKAVSTLAQARVPLRTYTGDKFKRYRASNATAIVGIAMDISYVVETAPTHALSDKPANDAIRTVQYLYDLELDATGNIVGGEWYSNAHPDFLWTPAPRTRAVSVGDRFISGSWDGRTAVPATWGRAAARASQYGQPLAAVVETLVTLSRLSGR